MSDTIFACYPLSLVPGLVDVYFQIGDTVIFNKTIDCWRAAPVVTSRIGLGEFVLRTRKVNGAFVVQVLQDGVVIEEFSFTPLVLAPVV